MAVRSVTDRPSLAAALAAEAAARTLVDFRWDPAGWAARKGIELWSVQRRILAAVAANRQVAVHSCHGIGKTFTASLAVEWWVQTRTPGEARALSTAPGFAQVRALLWSEVGKLHNGFGLPGRVTQTELFLPMAAGGEYLAAFGRKPSEYGVATFQGVHAPEGVLLVADEAAGVPEKLLGDAEKNLTGPDDRLLLIGNPDDPASYFARICRGEVPGWVVIHVGAPDTPNWTGEQVSDRIARSLISKEWAAGQALKYGENSSTYLSRVMGLFPEESTESVVFLSHVARARRGLDEPARTPKVLGVDVGAGGDLTVAQEREGQVAGKAQSMRSSDPHVTGEWLVAVIQQFGPDRVNVDAIGIGWGIVGYLRQAVATGRIHCHVEAVNVATASTQPDRFVNLRSELWWRARERSQAQPEPDWDLSGAPEDAIAQLSWPRWSFDPKKRIRVEPKEDTIARHGHSPDDADALNLAFYDPPDPGPAAVVPPPAEFGFHTLPRW